jgi:Flp pilus assembly pilin Flp
MRKFLVKSATKFLNRKEEGATMAEYGMLLALIAVVLVTTIGLFKDAIVTAFTNATAAMSGGS